MTAYIAYNNYFEADAATTTAVNSVGVGTASAETTTAPHENAYNWNTYDFWTPSTAGSWGIKVDVGTAVLPDYVAIAAHDLGDDATGYLQLYSSDINSASSVTGDPATGWVSEWGTSGNEPTSDRPWLWKITTTDADTRRYWMLVVVTTTTVWRIGCLSFGQLLALPNPPPVGYSPLHWAQNQTQINSLSEGGQLLGRQVIREGRSGSIPITYATRTWMDSNWTSLVDHALIKPFWYVYDYENQPDEVVFCWLDGNQGWPRYQTPDVFNANLRVRALY